MSKILIVVLLVGCASTPKKPDWVAAMEVISEAYWRTEHCVEPNSAKCDALWQVRTEIQAIIAATRAQFEREHQAEVQRLTTP